MFGKFFSRNKIFGYNLKRWNYLGSTTVKVKDERAIVTEWPLYFFSHKKTMKREFSVTDIYSEEIRNLHPFVLNSVIPWSMGEGLLNDVVRRPSKFLTEFMKDEHGIMYDTEHDCWFVNSQSEKTKNFKTDGNVTYLDF